MSDTAVLERTEPVAPPADWRSALKTERETPADVAVTEKKPEDTTTGEPKQIGRNERRLLRQNGALKQRLDALESRLNGTVKEPEATATSEATASTERPKRADFETPEAYEDKLLEWQAAKLERERAEKSETDKNSESVKTATTRYDAALADALKEIPSLKDTMAKAKGYTGPNIPAVVVVEIVDSCLEGGSNLGPIVTAYLIENPEEIKKLDGMSDAARKRYYFNTLEPAAEKFAGRGAGDKTAAAPKGKDAEVSEGANPAARTEAKPRQGVPPRLEGGAAPAGDPKDFASFKARRQAERQAQYRN